MNKPIFIVLEGLNGSGKTTLATILAERLGAIYTTTPAALFKSARSLIDSDADAVARFLFYLAGTYQSSVEISGMLDAGKSVVCDRYYYTTICSGQAMGLNVELPSFLDFLQPDFAFLVTCDQKVRLGRMPARGISINDARERDDIIEERTMSAFHEFGLVEVDNSADGAEFACERMAKLIGRGE